MRAFVRLLVLLGLVVGVLSPVVAQAADSATGPVVQIDTRPDSTTTSTSADFAFSTDQPDVGFTCSLAGPGQDAATAAPCDSTSPAPAGSVGTTGAQHYGNLAPGAYTFTVHAVVAGSAGPDASYTWTVTSPPPPAVTKPVLTFVSATAGGKSLDDGADTIQNHVVVTYDANQPDVHFDCSLTPSSPAVPCSVTAAVAGANRYVVDLQKLSAAHYHLTVTPWVLDTDGVTHLNGDPVSFAWSVLCSVRTDTCPFTAPLAYSPPAGAHFNIPLGTVTQRRRLLDQVTSTVRSMPGFNVHGDTTLCSDDPADYPSTIRISLYSVTNESFGRAMVAAAQRCASVQILMNNHLSPATDAAIAMMQDAFGTYPRNGDGSPRRTFARMCGGCRGHGVLHSKFYLFDTAAPAGAGVNGIRDTLMVGSSNMTGNASGVQWNNLYTVRGQHDLYEHFLDVFDVMKLDVPDTRTYDFRDGNYETQFWPRAAGNDPQMTALRSIRCTGATGGAGVNGRSIVYINIHAWFGTRGYALANQVRSMYNHGCYVRVLYSFMSYSVWKKLHIGTGSRMSLRRTIFSMDGDKYADVYSHNKLIAASGNIRGDSSAWASWTGSMNFTNDGVHFDEVQMRINGVSAYRQYRDEFNYIVRRKSALSYATFLEPIGGGRPVPEAKAARVSAETSTSAPTTVLPKPSATTVGGLPTD